MREREGGVVVAMHDGEQGGGCEGRVSRGIAWVGGRERERGLSRELRGSIER